MDRITAIRLQKAKAEVDIWTDGERLVVNFPTYQIIARPDGTVFVLDGAGHVEFERTFNFGD